MAKERVRTQRKGKLPVRDQPLLPAAAQPPAPWPTRVLAPKRPARKGQPCRPLIWAVAGRWRRDLYPSFWRGSALSSEGRSARRYGSEVGQRSAVHELQLA
jgi:hypothetical protein